jgi:HPt (histidine-containing phosphotransfer) domain-containing protein
MNPDEKKKILKELGGLDEVTYDELVNEFVRYTLEKLPDLKRAVDANNEEQIKTMAHMVKGSSSNLRLTEVHEAARNLEYSVKENKGSNAIKRYYNELKLELGKMVPKD